MFFVYICGVKVQLAPPRTKIHNGCKISEIAYFVLIEDVGLTKYFHVEQTFNHIITSL